MKKIFSLIFLFIIGTFIYSGIQISKVFTAEIPEIDENLQVVKKSKSEEKKEEQVQEVNSDEIKQPETKTNNNTQKQNNNQTKKVETKKQEINKQEVKQDSPKEEVKQEVVQPVQSEPVQQPVAQPQKVEEPQSVQQPRYETYSGEYYSWDECKNASINVAFETDARTMCYEAYTNSNGQVVYKIQLIY